jgi:hypothetical protein
MRRDIYLPDSFAGFDHGNPVRMRDTMRLQCRWP